VVTPEAAADILQSNKGTPGPGGSEESIWTGTDIGGDSGTSFVETDSDTIDINCKGSPETTKGFFVYQPITGDIQVVSKFTGYSNGTPVDFSFAGPRIADLTDADPAMVHSMWANVGRNRAKYRTEDAGALVTGIFGRVDMAVPTCQAITFRSSEGLANLFESEDATCDSDWELIAQDIPVDTTGENYAGIHCASGDANLLTASYDFVSVSNTITIVPETSPPVGPRTGIVWSMDFESEAIQATGVNPDGAYTKGMSGTVDGTCTPISTGNGGGDISSNHHTKVVTSENGVTPLVGSHMLSLRLEYDCDWENPINNPANKARTSINLTHLRTANVLPYDTNVWFGFGEYYLDHDAETGCSQCRVPVFEINTTGADSSVTMHLLPGAAQEFTISTQSCASCSGLPLAEANDIRYTGDIDDWIGRWMCVIGRVNSDNDSTGSLEMWLDPDCDGADTTDTKIIDFSGPLGPNVKTNEGLSMVYEWYKYSWKKTATTVSPPLIKYVDGIYFGLESGGTGYQDVHPKQEACTVGCP
jgi:hypothetical protein